MERMDKGCECFETNPQRVSLPRPKLQRFDEVQSLISKEETFKPTQKAKLQPPVDWEVINLQPSSLGCKVNSYEVLWKLHQQRSKLWQTD